MKLSDYFESTGGIGVLSTADGEGKVDAAIYARPHILEDGTAAFIMMDRLTHRNLQSNPHAAYLFIQEGHGYLGKRLFLTKIHEEKDTERLEEIRRKSSLFEEEIRNESKYLVVFRIEKELPLVGGG